MILSGGNIQGKYFLDAVKKELTQEFSNITDVKSYTEWSRKMIFKTEDSNP